MSDFAKLHKRLETLPQKVATPFRQLLSSGHISGADAGLILDAGELAGETSRLLGFAVAYLHLRSTGVPVHDVIAMAKSQKRRVNLGWSAKRWRSEHDRLSRAEALLRLATNNVRYDVSTFEAMLPKRFPGYLIRTSRRLGMEGLRQRHCIASYHSQIVAGRCAIASVFIDHERWTVQLQATNDPEAPLRINQIKTRLNGNPSATVRDCIHEVLGIALPRHVPLASDPAADCWLDSLRHVLPVLREHRIEHITVSFDGSGDSGSISDIAFKAPNDFDASAVTLAYRRITSRFEDGRWNRQSDPAIGSIRNAIEELTYAYLDETGVDWYNNDGGFGELEIDVIQGSVSLNVDVRFTESVTEFSTERNILTGEDL